MRIWKKAVSLLFLVGLASGLSAQNRFRLADPISLAGISEGWSVEARMGRLVASIPLTTIPGPIPIEVTYRIRGTYQELTTAQYEYDGVDDYTHKPIFLFLGNTTVARPAFGAQHFGYITSAANYNGVQTPQSYMLEDGTEFQWSDFVPFSSFYGTFNLPQSFGLPVKAASTAQMTVSASHATYLVTLAELGTGLQTLIQGVLPTGFGTVSSEYRVLFSKDRARIMAYLPAFNAYVPLVWLDRFGHSVTFNWSRKTSGMPTGMTAINAVSVKNHLQKGVQVQWGEFSSNMSVQDLLKISPIGVNAPSFFMKGYPGVSQIRPTNWSGPAIGSETFVVASPSVGGVCGRPVSLQMGYEGGLINPSWISSGQPLPPSTPDGNSTAVEVKSWQIGWDSNHAQMTGLTDATGIQTTFSNQLVEAAYPFASGGTARPGPVRVWAVNQSISTGRDGKVKTQSWAFGSASTGEPNTIQKETFGNINNCSRWTEFIYSAPSENLARDYCNGATKITKVWQSGISTPVSTTTFSLIAAGLAPEYSRASGITIDRLGEPLRTIAYTTATYALQNIIETQFVGSPAIKVSEKSTTFNAAREYLNLGLVSSEVVTRFDASGSVALIPNSTTTYEYKATGPSGLLENVYQTGAGIKIGQTYTYDSDGRVQSQGIYTGGAQPSPFTKTFAYDSATGATSSATTAFTDVNQSQATLVQSAQNFDSAGRPRTTLDERGVSTDITYDIYGRPLTVKKAGDGLLEYEYAPDGSSLTTWRTIGMNGSTPIRTKTLDLFDGFGRRTERQNPDGTKQKFSFDDFGRLIQTTTVNSLGTQQNSSSTSYDALNRPIQVKSPGGSSVQMGYSTLGNLAVINRTQSITSETGTLSVSTQEFLDALGQITKTIGADGTTTLKTFDGLGNLTQVTIRPSGQTTGGQTRSFFYDGLGRMTSKSEPETGSTTFGAFNVFGKPTTVTEASGRVRTLTYDGIGRVRNVTSSAGLEKLTYTFTGKDLTSASTFSDGGTITQSYEYQNPGNRLSKETTTQTGFTSVIQYGIDAYGKLVTATYPSTRVVGYSYDSLGRINGVNSNGSPIVSNVQFNEWGQTGELDFASGAYSQWKMNSSGTHLDQWIVGRSGTPFTDGGRSYSYDTGERLSQAGEWSLLHNNLGQLIQANYQAKSAGDPSYSTFHGYDAYGNQILHTTAGSVPAPMINYTLPALTTNKVPGTAANNALTGWVYNANGEATSMGVTVGSAPAIGLTWDALGRVSTATAPNATQVYGYAPSGLRVSLRDTVNAGRSRKYVYSIGGLLLGEHASTGAWKRDVIYLGSVAVAEIDANGVHELHLDHLGTPRLVTRGTTGQIEGRQSFGPYGEAMLNSSTDNTYVPLTGYTGHIQTDATGLIYMRGRFYNPAWHRFVNSDQGVDPKTWNQMAYVGGHPFMGIDPSGMTESTGGTGGDGVPKPYTWIDPISGVIYRYDPITGKITAILPNGYIVTGAVRTSSAGNPQNIRLASNGLSIDFDASRTTIGPNWAMVEVINYTIDLSQLMSQININITTSDVLTVSTSTANVVAALKGGMAANGLATGLNGGQYANGQISGRRFATDTGVGLVLYSLTNFVGGEVLLGAQLVYEEAKWAYDQVQTNASVFDFWAAQNLSPH